MGSIGHIGQTGFHLPQDFEQSLNQGGSAGSGALGNSPLEQLRNDPSQQGAGAGQGAGDAGAGSGGGLLSALQGIEDELKQLLQMGVGGTAPGQSSSPSGGGDGAGAAPAGAAASSSAAPTPSNAAAPASAAAPAGAAGAAPASSGAASAPAGGSSVDIDGGNAGGHGVVEKVDNNTGAAASFGWENAQGKLAGKLDLADGQSGTFNVNADGQDGKSARLIKLDKDGSIPVNSNLDETNLAVNPDGSLQVSPDVSQITAGSDSTKITITDGNGKSVGNDAAGGAYQYPTQDQVADPKGNPMTMAMDTSNQYDNNFKS